MYIPSQKFYFIKKKKTLFIKTKCQKNFQQEIKIFNYIRIKIRTFRIITS